MTNEITCILNNFITSFFMDQTQNQLTQNKGQNQPIWDPIDQLGLQVNKSDTEDYNQVVKLLTQILTYPSIDAAELHMDCNRLGDRDLRKDAEETKELKTKKENQMGEEAQYCPCCGFIKQDDNIKLCTHLKDINNLGISTFLYFETAKNLGILLLVMSLVYSIYALVTNLIASGKINVANYSVDTTADILSVSLASKMTDDTSENRNFYLIQCYIGLGMVVIWCFLLFVLKYFEKEQEVRVQEETISAADFSVVMEYVPKDMTQEEMQKQFNDYFQTITNVPANKKRPLEIVKYNVGKPFYLNEDALIDDEVKQLKEKHSEIIDVFVSWVEERQDSASFSTTKEERQQKYKEYEEILTNIGKKMEELGNKVEEQLKKTQDDATTTVFITFSSSYAKEMMADLNDPGFLSKIRYYITCCQGGNRFTLRKEDGSSAGVEIEQAPEPEDVLWQNLGLSDCQIFKRKLLTYTITLILLGISFAAVYGLSQAQLQNESNRALSLAISLVISLINVVIGQVIRVLTVLERDFTETKHQASLGFKSTLAQLMNCILVPMIVNALIKQKIYDQNGLAADVFMLGMTTAFVGPALKFFDPGYIINRLLKWFKSEPIRMVKMNQTELNETCEYIMFEVGYEYIYLTNLFLFTCFFVSLQPIIAITSTVGIFCMYWAQKYAIFNRMKRPVPGTDTINVAMFQLIYLGGVFYSLGALTWSNFFPTGYPRQALVPNLISLGFSIVIALLPYRAIFGLIFEDEGSICLEYQKNRILLPSEYDRLNPATSREGFDDYMKFIQEENKRINQAPEEEKKQLMKKFAKQQARGQQKQNFNVPGQAPMFPMFQRPPPQFMPPMNRGPPIINQGPPPIMNQGPPPIMNQGPPPPNMNQGPPPVGFNQPRPPPPGFGGPVYRPPPPGFGGPAYRPPPGFGMPVGQPGFQQPGFQQPGFQQPGFQQPPGFNPFMRR